MANEQNLIPAKKGEIRSPKGRGERLHHRIKSKYLYHKLLKGTKKDNIACDAYPENVPFRNDRIV